MATINLGSGDNTYSAPLGEVSVNAEGGNDRLIVDYSTVTGPIVYWYDGWQHLSDEAFNTIDYVNFEAFTIKGGSESDDIRGGNGEGVLADSLMGGGGNDTIHSGLGNDAIDGGAGVDRWVVDYSSLGIDVAVELKAGGTVYTVGASGAQVKNIEALSISTGVGADLIKTHLVIGDDNIDSGEGDDTVQSGLGFDNVRTYGGIDTLILNYTGKTEDILHTYDSGWYIYQDGLDPTTSIRYYRPETEMYNITGGDGNDNLSGRSDYDGNDRLVGNAGNDTLYGYGGVDTINGGAGTDTWVVNYDEVNDNVAINISGATQTASTGATLSGIEQLSVDTYLGDDTITCNAGVFNDVIYTRDGNDRITTGRGVDVVEAGYGATDTMIVDWSAVTTDINHVYDSGWYLYTSGSGDSVRHYSVEVLNVKGGSGNDYISSFGGDDTLSGGDGNDTLNSSSGRATIDGGAGTDYWQADVSGILTGLVVNAATSQTTAQGTAAGHSIRNIEGFLVTSGAGNDSLNSEGFSTNDSVDTGSGNDTVSLGLGFDTVNGGYGDTDTLILDYSSLTTAISRTYDGGWYIYGDKLGTASNRHYSFETFNLKGGAGGDRLYGGGNNDTLVGNAGNDILDGGAGRDSINGGAGKDRWIGDHSSATAALTLTLNASGNGTLKGNGVNWTPLSGIENITLDTGASNDTINTLALRGNNTINTNNGNDTVKLGSGMHNVNGGGNTGVGDTLVVNFSSSTSAIRQVYDSGWYKIYDTAGFNSVRHYGFEQFELTGGAGHDRLYAWNGADKLVGGGGNDVLTGQGGDDVLTGGAGNDIFAYATSGNGADTITDAGVGDTIRIGSLSTVLTSIALGDGTTVGNNQVQLSVDAVNNESTLYVGTNSTAGAEVTILLQGTYTLDSFTLSGRDIMLTKGSTNTPTPGDDIVNGTTGNDELSGGAGNDKLIGKAGNDLLDGGTGNDSLTGGTGADTMTGGDGADRFIYTSIWDSTPGTLNHDEITDFVSGSDKIDLSAIDANPVLAGNQAFAFVAAGFTGSAGEVYYAGTGLVLADINGDGLTDIEIYLSTEPASMAATDFIL